jgi:hypothetical protein
MTGSALPSVFQLLLGGYTLPQQRSRNGLMDMEDNMNEGGICRYFMSNDYNSAKKRNSYSEFKNQNSKQRTDQQWAVIIPTLHPPPMHRPLRPAGTPLNPLPMNPAHATFFQRFTILDLRILRTCI